MNRDRSSVSAAIASSVIVSEPVQLQWLSDYAGLQHFLAVEMAYGVDATVSDFILNGGSSENGTAQSGILTTTGFSRPCLSREKIETLWTLTAGSCCAAGAGPGGVQNVVECACDPGARHARRGSPGG